jgi:hypothetical protein
MKEPDDGVPFMQEFGGTFLSRFEGSETDSEVLKSLNIVDTPGILGNNTSNNNINNMSPTSSA